MLKRFLAQHSCATSHIEYRGFLSNHMAHGLIALADLGASEAALGAFAAHYGEKLEPAEPDSPPLASLDEALALRGSRQRFGALRAFFLAQAAERGLDAVVGDVLPAVIHGMQGSAFHALIHLGYGLHAGRDAGVVCEGLAYMLHSYIESDLGAAPRVADPVEPPLDVLREAGADAQLKADMEARVAELTDMDARGFQRYMRALGESGGALAAYADRIAAPAAPADALALALTVHAHAGNNDFFLLHGVTAAFALCHAAEFLDEDTQAAALRTFVRALVATYVAQGAPPLAAALEPVAGGAVDWDAHKAAAVARAPAADEHIYKLVQVAAWAAERGIGSPEVWEASVGQVLGGPDSFF